jgi:hypothetical protein
MAVAPLVGEGMVTRRVVMRSHDVVFFKGVVEASEGLAAVFAEHGGDLVVAAPVARAAELDEVLGDLCREVDALLMSDASSDGMRDVTSDADSEAGSGAKRP